MSGRTVPRRAEAPAVPVSPLPLSWGRAFFRALTTGLGRSAWGGPLVLLLLLAVGITLETTGLGDADAFDLFARRSVGGAALWGAGAGLLALILGCMTRQTAVRLADRRASEIRPPAVERAALARSWVGTVHWSLMVAEAFVGLLLLCAIIGVFMDPEHEMFVFLGVLAALFVLGIASIWACSRVLQPRWNARWDSIRKRWPATSSEPLVVVIRRAPYLSDVFIRLMAGMVLVALLCWFTSCSLFRREAHRGESGELAGGVSRQLVAGYWLGCACLALLALALLALLVSVVIEDIGRIREARRHRGGRAESAEDAAREVVDHTPGEGTCTVLFVLAGLCVSVGLTADVGGEPSAELLPMLDLARSAYLPAAGLGLLGTLTLTVALHARRKLQQEILAAHPDIDPVRALTWSIHRSIDAGPSLVDATEGDDVDQEASLRAARDEARGVLDD